MKFKFLILMLAVGVIGFLPSASLIIPVSNATQSDWNHETFWSDPWGWYVGDTGNAKGKPPHLHYEILSVVPLPWRIDRERLGWLKAFHLNPSEELLNDTSDIA